MNFGGLRNIETTFFIPAWFVLPSITRAELGVTCSASVETS